MNILNKFWKGEITLWKSFWGGILIIYPLGLAIAVVISTIIDSITPISIAMPVIVIFFSIGVWRSANKYQGSKFWVWFVKIYLFFVFVGMIGGINYL